MRGAVSVAPLALLVVAASTAAAGSGAHTSAASGAASVASVAAVAGAAGVAGVPEGCDACGDEPGTAQRGGDAVPVTAMVVAFLPFGRRRRDGDTPASDGALAPDPTPSAGPTPNRPSGFGPDPLVELGAAARTGAQAAADESTMPRWRRPSLQAARKADPLRATVETPHLTFATNGAGEPSQATRRTIRYRLVRLLDSPDELRSREIGILDEGDEVQLLERSGAYWLVLCPDGSQGWLHRMTLAEPAAPAVAETDVRLLAMSAMLGGEGLRGATGPVRFVEPAAPAEASFGGDDETGSGLLEAYIRARHNGG